MNSSQWGSDPVMDQSPTGDVPQEPSVIVVEDDAESWVDYDQLLLERGAQGDSQAIAELYARHRQAGLKYATKLVGASDAEDLVSEAFARILSRINAQRPPQGQFRPYLVRAIYHRFVDDWRSQGRVTITDDIEDIPQLSPDPGDSDIELVVAGAFAELPARWQAALWHTVVEGEPMDETARRLGTSVEGLRSLTYRARRALFDDVVTAMPLPDASCAEARTWMSGDEKLGVRASRRLKKHLASCTECRAVEPLASHANVGVTGPLIASALLGKGAAGVQSARWASRARILAPWVGASAAATLALVAFLIVLFTSDSENQTRTVGDQGALVLALSPATPVEPAPTPTPSEAPATDVPPPEDETEGSAPSPSASVPDQTDDSAIGATPDLATPDPVIPSADPSGPDPIATPAVEAPSGQPLAITDVTSQAQDGGVALHLRLEGAQPGDQLTFDLPGVTRARIQPNGSNTTLVCRAPSEGRISCTVAAASSGSGLELRTWGADTLTGGTVRIIDSEGEGVSVLVP